MLIYLFMVLFVTSGAGVQLNSIYPYGSGSGDAALGAVDDAISPVIPLAPGISFIFYGISYSTLYVSNSANVSYMCIN